MAHMAVAVDISFLVCANYFCRWYRAAPFFPTEPGVDLKQYRLERGKVGDGCSVADEGAMWLAGEQHGV
jgi:hypothetical protein